MSALPVLLVALGGGAVMVRRHLNTTNPGPVQVGDLAKAGQLFGLAADWLRTGDPTEARALLDLVGPDGWQFAHDEVVQTSGVPRIAAMSGRMSAAGLLTTPPGAVRSTDRLAQIETLNAIATEIRARVRQR